MALAVSITRATSVAVTSLSLMATMPLEFRPRMWLPVMPVHTRWILQSAISSASFKACWMLCTVASMFTTTPRLSPLLGATPRPASLSSPLYRTSATTTMTLAVPMSSPTITSLYSLAISASAPGWFCPVAVSLHGVRVHRSFLPRLQRRGRTAAGALAVPVVTPRSLSAYPSS